MGENALGFDGAHVLGAITELFGLLVPDSEDGPVTLLQGLQKRFKYGLPSGAPIVLYEAGFSDRSLAQDLARLVPGVTSRSTMRDALRAERETVAATLSGYPQYFMRVFERVVG